jgi:delta-aminolevulinic acid dehydratase/porphobilinogen synthase
MLSATVFSVIVAATPLITFFGVKENEDRYHQASETRHEKNSVKRAIFKIAEDLKTSFT